MLSGYVPAPTIDLRQAYAFARGVVKLSSELEGPGHRLVWVRGASFASTTLPATEGAYCVVGRHTQCGVVLPDDPFVALRHVLVRSLALPAGGLAVRIFDLHTGAGFVLADGTRHSSIFAEGPVVVAIGEYALVALPTESKGDELPVEMPAPVIDTTPHARAQLEALAAAMSPYRMNARPLNRHSRITLMPRLVMVGEPMPPNLQRLTTGGHYALTLTRGPRSATVTLSDEDLAGGVIIGRSEKCHSEALRRVTDLNTSRTHQLVLREGDSVWAYDIASTHGTYLPDGTQTRRALLSSVHGGGAKSEVVLGAGESAVRLSWHARY